MAQPVKYKKPRRINAVSVTLAAILTVLGVMAWEYLPLFIAKQEAYRVLESYSSTFAGRKNMYRKDTAAREALRHKMDSDLRDAGVNDPNSESWIEVDGKEVRFGVVYTMYIEWPLDLVARTEEVYEIEHIVVLN